MSCTLLDYPERSIYGFRVVRQIGGQVYDEYFSLIDKRRQAGAGAGGYARLSGAAFERVRRRALRRDAELAGMQRVYRAYEAAQALPQSRAARGATVRGIRYCGNRPGRAAHLNPLPGFLVSVMAGGRRCTRFFALSSPIDARGWRDAWTAAVVHLARVKRLRDWAALLAREPRMHVAPGAAARARRRGGGPD